MSVQAQVEPLVGKLPPLVWRWDPETDILSGSFKPNRKREGLTGTVELADEVGSVAVLDVHNGAISGLDIVVWPEVTTVPDLAAPPRSTNGRVVLPASPGRAEVVSIEVDAALWVMTNGDESVFHVRIGPERPGDAVRIADHLYVEIDPAGVLAGFWLTGVPPFPAGEDY